MHTGAFAAAGQRLADTDDSFSSAPRGILIGQIPQILRAKKFDGTRGGQRLDIWLEEIDKAIIVNPDVFRAAESRPQPIYKPPWPLFSRNFRGPPPGGVAR